MLNKCILMGRLTKDPEVRYSQAAEPIAVARYTLAVNRRVKKDDQSDADFIPCVAFGKVGEFAEKYLKKGIMIAVVGRIQVRNWTDNSGQKRWTTEVVVEEQNFAESKKESAASVAPANSIPSTFDPYADNSQNKSDFNINKESFESDMDEDDDLPF